MDSMSPRVGQNATRLKLTNYMISISWWWLHDKFQQLWLWEVIHSAGSYFWGSIVSRRHFVWGILCPGVVSLLLVPGPLLIVQ